MNKVMKFAKLSLISFSILKSTQSFGTYRSQRLNKHLIFQKYQPKFRTIKDSYSLNVISRKTNSVLSSTINDSKDENNIETDASVAVNNSNKQTKVSIEYCTGCRWMLRAAWLAQELLTTFQDDLHSVSLVPSRPPSPAGSFIISLTDSNNLQTNQKEVIIWNRKLEGRFPESKEVKQRIRDYISPQRDLGHSDVSSKSTISIKSSSQEETSSSGCDECERNEEINNSDEQNVIDQGETSSVEFMDDDDASEMRNYFGVA